ncbi:MAG: glycosyltransferase family 39 protein [Candidatus Omnitrophica bacterium]|nr:glycosyltransferase family 39 protein [Candidatus Omnitrophota bacterium]
MLLNLSRERWILLGILALGFVLRFYAVDFGLPHLYHADEPIIVNHALAYGTGDFNPHFFKIPPLTSYLLFGLYACFYLAGRLTGLFSSPSDFEIYFYQDPSIFYWLARCCFGVLLGTLTVYLVYRLGKRFFSLGTGLLSGLLMSVAFLHVRDSHYIYADIPLVFVMVFALIIILQIPARGGEKFWHVSAGAVIGIAAAFKYNGAALIIAYGIALMSTRRIRDAFKAIFLAFLSGAFVFILLNPFSILDHASFMQEVAQESKAHLGGVSWIKIVYYSLIGAVGYPIVLFAVFQLFRPSMWKNSENRILAVFLLSYLGILKVWGQPYARYVLPLVPIMVLFAADFWLCWVRKINRNRKLILWIGILSLCLPTMIKSLRFDFVMSQADTRTLALNWFEKHIPKGKRVAMDIEFYMPRLRFSEEQLMTKMEKIKDTPFAEVQKRKLEYYLHNAGERPGYWLYGLRQDGEDQPEPFLMAKEPVPYDLDRLKDIGVDFVIVARLRKDDANRHFYNNLSEKTQLVATFNPYRGGRPKWAMEHPITGGPFLWKDLWRRERNGQPLYIYRI